MKKVFQFFLFLAAFQMEVRVRASGDLLQQPEACLQTKGSCVVQAPATEFVFQREGLSLRAPPQATLERKSEKEWRLIQGSVWVEKGHKVSVETVFAEVRSRDGEFWVLEKEGRFWIRNISADLTVHLRDGKELPLPAGFEFWVSGINTKAQNEFGVLQPISLKNHLKDWAQLYPGTSEQFKKDVQELKENWKSLASKSGDIYQQVTNRRLASIAEAKRQEQIRKDNALAEQKRVKELYFHKVFER
ncbi:hypothetical protein [Bdellovibrio sp. HCB2-146]|uniref:hypothetical protein n=1 Tax=Bdellovibrio sp. HCB2-146 TaxID=3394362 RepID=UPI0039BC8111